MPTKKYKRNKPELPEWFETKKFKKLAKKWHDKLIASGFNDKEEFDSPLELMREHHNNHFMNKFTPIEFEERQRYFELAAQLVFEYKFDSLLDKKIWKGHSEGKPERKIAEELECQYNYVRRVIKKVKLAIKRDAKDILDDIDKAKVSND